MNEIPSPIKKPFVSLATSWLLPLIIAYLIALPLLWPGSLFVPTVITNAPLGVIGCFEKIAMNATGDQISAVQAIHATFWPLFGIGFFGRNKIPIKVLWILWIVIVATLAMSVSGCAVQLGPAIRDEGNWH